MEYRTMRYRFKPKEEGLDTTPKSEYYLPILQTLIELGGEARRPIVLETLFMRMLNRFKPDDLTLAEARDEPRWQKSVGWAARALVKDGDMHRPIRGYWVITSQGRRLVSDSQQS